MLKSLGKLLYVTSVWFTFPSFLLAVSTYIHVSYTPLHCHLYYAKQFYKNCLYFVKDNQCSSMGNGYTRVDSFSPLLIGIWIFLVFYICQLHMHCLFLPKQTAEDECAGYIWGCYHLAPSARPSPHGSSATRVHSQTFVSLPAYGWEMVFVLGSFIPSASLESWIE